MKANESVRVVVDITRKMSVVVLVMLSVMVVVAPAGHVSASDGSAWSSMESGVTNHHLYGVWGSSPTDVFAVGGRYILHYDGTAWSRMSNLTTLVFRDVWGSSATDVFAVGDGIAHYDGSTWKRMGWISQTVGAVWGSSSSDVFAVGNSGAILHYDGSDWSAMNSSTTNSLSDVWGNSPSDVFAVGYDSTIVHYDGSAWQPMSINSTCNLTAVWGSSSSDVFALGSGVILHYDGSDWNVMNAPWDSSSGDLFDKAIWGSSSSDVFVVDQSGIQHYNGFIWSPMCRPDAEYLLHAVWGNSSSDVYAVGQYGTILHYSGGGDTMTPTLDAVSPSAGMRGQTLTLYITGSNLSGARSATFGPGIRAYGFSTISGTELAVQVTIDSSASLGTRDLSLSIPDCPATITLPGAFTVEEVEEDGSGEAGSCSCSKAKPDVSMTGVAVSWGSLGLCSGALYLLAKQAGRRKK